MLLKQIIIKDYTRFLKDKNEYKLTCLATCVLLILHITATSSKVPTQLPLTAYSTTDSQVVYIC